MYAVTSPDFVTYLFLVYILIGLLDWARIETNDKRRAGGAFLREHIQTETCSAFETLNSRSVLALHLLVPISPEA